MPAFRNKLSSLLRNNPNSYSTPFNSFSLSQKSLNIKTLHQVANHLSGGNPQQIFNYFYQHSHLGKSIFSNAQSPILQRIQAMHTIAVMKYKSSILALVAGLHSRNDLKSAGFNFSNTQYRTAMRKAQKQNFSLSGYQHHIPHSHTSTSQDTINLVKYYLQQNSRISSSTTIIGQQPVYYLEKPKCEIYQHMKVDNPGKYINLFIL